MSSDNGTGGSTSDDEDSENTAVKPWWRRTSFVASVTAVIVTVLAGWLQQGGVSLIETLFREEEKISAPLVSVKASEDPLCNVWLLRGTPYQTAGELTKELSSKAPDPMTDAKQQQAIADRIRKSSGARLPTGAGVQVTIQGAKESAVVLTSLDVSVTKRIKEVPGTLMGAGVGCGDGLGNRRYELDLDDQKPAFKLVKTLPDGSRDPDAIDFPYKVASSAPEYLTLAGSSAGYAEWTATLHWISDGHEGETKISNRGMPFVSFPSSFDLADFTYNNETFQLSKTSPTG